MALVIETGGRVEYHPVREVGQTISEVPHLARVAVREFFGLFTHGNLPDQPFAQHGDHMPKETFDDGCGDEVYDDSDTRRLSPPVLPGVEEGGH